VADRAALAQRLADVVQGGGEGLMLHRADADWRPGRSDALLKLKPVHDAEALVIDHVPGRGKHAGRLGALRVRTDEGIEFLLGTGFSDAQREQPPLPGSVVTYTHRGSTAGGVPRFASFLRLREGAI
jgi:DNA ligase 1